MIPNEWTTAISSWASRNPEIEEIWLYGSYARGEATEASDLDLAVVPAGNMDERLLAYVGEASGWTKHLQALLQVKIHLELGDRTLSDTVVGPALRVEGVRIYPA
jgi:predicted nucleotidyltransferase